MATTLQTIQDELRDLTERVAVIEYRQVRFMRMWIASHLISSISGKTAQTDPSSMGHTVSSPTTAPAITPKSSPSEPPILKHGKRILPRLLGWAGEKLIGAALPYITPILISLWALVWRYGEAMWLYLSGAWHWLVG